MNILQYTLKLTKQKNMLPIGIVATQVSTSTYIKR